MIILGDRILVSRIEEEKKEGFQTIEVQDSFLYKGKIEMIGQGCEIAPAATWTGSAIESIEPPFNVGSVVMFAKYSPHTQTINVEGVDMKVIRIDDVIAVL